MPKTAVPSPTQVRRDVPSSSSSSSKSRAGLAAAAGVATGTAIQKSRNGSAGVTPPGYGSIGQSEQLKGRVNDQVRNDPAARKSVANHLRTDPGARQAAITRLETDPKARATARAAATGSTVAHRQATGPIMVGDRPVHSQLPAGSRPVRYNYRGHHHHHYYRPRRRYSHYYCNGYYWYRPYYYGGYVYYEEIPAPVGAEVEELPEEDYETVVIDGVEYYQYGDVLYKKTADGYEVVESPGAATFDDEEGELPAGLEDSKAVTVLREMSDYLQTLDSFRLDATETHDSTDESGERLQRSNKRRVFVTKPDKLKMSTAGDGINRQFWYDGKQATLYSTVLNAYAAAKVPNTLDEMMAVMASEYGLSFPLADVFYADIYYSLSANLMTADYVGEHHVGDVACHHLAFSQKAIDWQIWVDKSEQALPRKIQISYKLEPGIPVYTMEITELKKTAEEPEAYDFKPPADAIEIEMTPL